MSHDVFQVCSDLKNELWDVLINQACLIISISDYTS